MDFFYALTYIFEDKQWTGKIVMLMVFSILSLIPLFGLLAMAVALGYNVQIIDNVRTGLPRPLPKWVDMGTMFSQGGAVLVAFIVYFLPVFIIGGCIMTVVSAFGGVTGELNSLVVICCVLPVTIIYTLVMWPLFAVGLALYSKTRDINAFFRFGNLADIARVHSSLTLKWMFLSAIWAVLTGFVAVIPCLGWFATLGFSIPVQGHLLGQFARQISLPEKARRHNKKTS